MNVNHRQNCRSISGLEEFVEVDYDGLSTQRTPEVDTVETDHASLHRCYRPAKKRAKEKRISQRGLGLLSQLYPQGSDLSFFVWQFYRFYKCVIFGQNNGLKC